MKIPFYYRKASCLPRFIVNATANDQIEFLWTHSAISQQKETLYSLLIISIQSENPSETFDV